MSRTSTAKTSDVLRNTEIVKKAVEGDVEAYGELYSIYLDPIYRYIFYQVRDRMMAEDITEDVFIKAWKAIRSCRGREQTFSSWLYRIAHNHLVDTYRKRHDEVPLEPDNHAGAASFEKEVESTLEWQEVQKVISCLPEQQRQVVVLKFIEGMDNDEIGRIMGKRQGAIRALQMRALITLKQRLGMEANGNGR